MIVLDGDPLTDIGVMQDPERYLKLLAKGRTVLKDALAWPESGSSIGGKLE